MVCHSTYNSFHSFYLQSFWQSWSCREQTLLEHTQTGSDPSLDTTQPVQGELCMNRSFLLRIVELEQGILQLTSWQPSTQVHITHYFIWPLNCRCYSAMIAAIKTIRVGKGIIKLLEYTVFVICRTHSFLTRWKSKRVTLQNIKVANQKSERYLLGEL